MYRVTIPLKSVCHFSRAASAFFSDPPHWCVRSLELERERQALSSQRAALDNEAQALQQQVAALLEQR